MSLGIYTIILAIFRPPIIMLSLRVGYDYTRPWVYENAQLKTFCLGNDDKFRTKSRKAFSVDMRLKLTGKEGGRGGGGEVRLIGVVLRWFLHLKYKCSRLWFFLGSRKSTREHISKSRSLVIPWMPLRAW